MSHFRSLLKLNGWILVALLGIAFPSESPGATVFIDSPGQSAVKREIRGGELIAPESVNPGWRAKSDTYLESTKNIH